MNKDQCEGCRCAKCRWRGAGSNCHYNDRGEESSRCSWCLNAFLKGEELRKWKQGSYLCRGYEKKRMMEK